MPVAFGQSAGHQNESTKAELKKANQALKESPKDYTLYIRRGLIYWESQQMDEAAANFQKSIKLNPYKPSKKQPGDLENFQKLALARAYYNLGSIDCFKKQYKTAIPYFTKTIELAPNFPEAYKNRGLAYRALDQKEPAVADLRKAQQLFSSPKTCTRWPPADMRGPVSKGPDGEIDEPLSGHMHRR